MSGFVRNDWGKYLNGGSSHYNFEYRSQALLEPTPTPTPTTTPTTTPAPIPIALLNTLYPKKNNKDGKMVIPTHKGGKRKSLRNRRSHKRSNKNKRRRTHCK